MSLAHPAGGGLPHGVLVDPWHPCLARLRRGQPVWLVESVGVGLAPNGGGPVVVTGRAKRWDPSVVGLARDPSPGWQERLRQAWRLLAERSPAESLGALAGSLGTLNPLQRRAERLLGNLLAGLAEGDDTPGDDAVATSARGLIGLGPGLTPSGDDLLVGLLIGAWSLDPAPAAAAGRAPLAAVAARTDATTDISAAYLHHAAAGRAAEPLRDVLLAIARANGGPGVAEAMSRALAVGSTSGADGLLGLLCGLTLWAASDLWPPGIEAPEA